MCGGWGVPEDDESPAGEGGCGKKKAVGEKVVGPSFDKGRRGFTTAAMASPVLMSLLSKPAWSQVACSISGLTSGNVSSPGGIPSPCSGDGMGCTPGFWKNNPEAWVVNTHYSPGSCASWNNGGKCQEWSTAGGTSFYAAFGCAAPDGDPDLLDTPTMMDLLILGESPHASVNHAWQAHWIAALLNATASPAYGSSPGDIIAAVCAVASTGTWEINGQSIDAAQLHATLKLMNERDCAMNAHGFCEGTFLNNTEGTCIPSCGEGQKFDVNSGDCINEGDWVQGGEDQLGSLTKPVHCSVDEALLAKPWCTNLSP